MTNSPDEVICEHGSKPLFSMFPAWCTLDEKVHGAPERGVHPCGGAPGWPRFRKAKMPDAQLSKAPAVSHCEIQLDILTKLAVPCGRNIKRVVAWLSR